MAARLPKAHQQLLAVNFKAMLCSSRAGHLSHVARPCVRIVVPVCHAAVMLCISLVSHQQLAAFSPPPLSQSPLQEVLQCL